MDEQNLPIHRGTVGFYDIRELTLGPWQRMGPPRNTLVWQRRPSQPPQRCFVCEKRYLVGGVSARGV